MMFSPSPENDGTFSSARVRILSLRPTRFKISGAIWQRRSEGSSGHLLSFLTDKNCKNPEFKDTLKREFELVASLSELLSPEREQSIIPGGGIP